MSSLDTRIDNELDRKSLEEWLNLTPEEFGLATNPFQLMTQEDIENPHVFLLDMMRKSENFGFTCKHLFGVTLAPFQIAILHELWHRNFPLLCATRGGGKSWILAVYIMLRLLFCQGAKIVIVGAAFRQSKVVFEYCEQLWRNGSVYRDLAGNTSRDGPRRDIDRCYIRVGDSICTALPLGSGEKIRGYRANIIIADEMACLEKGTLVETDIGIIRIGEDEGPVEAFQLCQPDGGTLPPARLIRTPPTKAYRVTTKYGYEFVCSSIHKVQTTNGWKLAKDLTPKDYLIHQSSDIWPSEKVSVEGLTIDIDEAWLLGALVAEGWVSGKYNMNIKSTDESFIEEAQEILNRLSPNKPGVHKATAYVDARGWLCKASQNLYCCSLELRDRLEKLGLGRTKAIEKRIPWSILRSPKEQVIAFLRGLFDGDGSAFHWKTKKRKNNLGVAFYSASHQLAREVQQVCFKLGVRGMRHPRKSKISPNSQWMVRFNGRDAHKLANLLNVPRWKEIVASASVPYDPPRKGVIWLKDKRRWKAEKRVNGKYQFIGSFEREEDARKAVEQFSVPDHLKVWKVEELPGEHVLYDYYVPGSNCFLAACFVQHNSIPVDIFENVVSGFAAVSMSPVEKTKMAAQRRAMEKLGMVGSEAPRGIPGLTSNQTILSGTCSWSFNPFYQYWKRYKAIIESRGNRDKLNEIFLGEIPENFDHRDYSIIRIPYDLLPPSFMDEKHIAKAKATIHRSNYLLEYAACWATDSAGFFKRSLIETCVVGKPEHPIRHRSTGETEIRFTATLRGDPKRTYVMAIDPASERDNFSIFILECWPEHRRIRYGWTITRSRHKAKVNKGVETERDFYSYCARKIRTLMKLFPCERIAIDSQGGGVAITEALQDPKRCTDGELLVLPVVDYDNPKDTDSQIGLHVLELISFAKAEWVAEANHGLRKDLEDKVLLFPEFDPAVLALAVAEDQMMARVQENAEGEDITKLYDTLEDCVMEIEELKDELASIVHTPAGQGSSRDRWDTPETKLAGGKKGRQKKDRYSALLMANMVARQLARVITAPEYECYGGFASSIVKQKEQERPKAQHINPSWYKEPAGTLIKRGR